jgi:NAD(P)H-dependent flavin oxidoreductase YrpB (nitropropane dioxygenase family)
MLFQPEARDTQLTRVFSGRLVRAIRNRFMDDMTKHAADLPTPDPELVQRLASAAIEQGRPIFFRFRPVRGRTSEGENGAGSWDNWCGKPRPH